MLLIYSFAIFLTFIASKQKSINTTTLQRSSIAIPLFSSIFLLLLYLIMKYFHRNNIENIVGLIFSITGHFTLSKNFKYLIDLVYFKLQNTRIIENTMKHRMFSIISHILSFFICIRFFVFKSWIANNIISSSLLIYTIRSVNIGSVLLGNIFLILIFIYDICWVYFFPVMEIVTEELNIPLKIVIPAGNIGFHIIGLGDLMIPGLYISTINKFCKAKKNHIIYYFTYFGYCLGLGTSILISMVYEKPQPALMFICPFLTFTSFLSAMICKNFLEFVKFKIENNTVVS